MLRTAFRQRKRVRVFNAERATVIGYERDKRENAHDQTRSRCGRRRGAALGALVAAPALAQTCSGPLRKINVGVAVAPPNVVHTAPYVAKALGFFAKRCIDANIIQFDGGARRHIGDRRRAGHRDLERCRIPRSLKV